jgi:GrpB-like predicted nucleotidyltransferase (UPF0157 family)
MCSAAQHSQAEPIRICEYDPQWEQKYAAERMRIVDALNGVVSEIHHIGSTALPGVAAKDCIDILVAVNELGSAQQYSALESLGYVYEQVPDKDRLFFRRQTPSSHHLHIVQK